MKYPCANTSLTLIAAATSVLFISAISARAQQRRQPERVLSPRLETRESLQREFNRRMNIVDNPHVVLSDDYHARRQLIRMMTAAQVRKDTERIQFFNSTMMRSVSLSKPLDYEQIAKATGEIKKRASRLMTNLKLPKLDKSEKPEIGPEFFDNAAMAVSLKRLDELVRRFFANPLPLPGNVGVLNVKSVTDSRRTLAEIIVLSDHIRRSAKRLRQAERQSH